MEQRSLSFANVWVYFTFVDIKATFTFFFISICATTFPALFNKLGTSHVIELEFYVIRFSERWATKGRGRFCIERFPPRHFIHNYEIVWNIFILLDNRRVNLFYESFSIICIWIRKWRLRISLMSSRNINFKIQDRGRKFFPRITETFEIYKKLSLKWSGIS